MGKKIAMISWGIIRHTMATLIAFTIVVGGIALWQLNQKPVDLLFVLPEVQKYVSNKNADIKITADEMMLSAEMSRMGILHLHVKNLNILDKNDDVILNLPAVDFAYGLSHILTLNYVPTSMQISDALLQFTLTKDNQVVISKKNNQKTVLVKNIKDIQERLFAFRYFLIDNSSIIINDKKNDKKVAFLGINAEFKRHRFSQFLLKATTDFKIDNQSTIGLDLNAKVNKVAQNVTFKVKFNDLKMTDFAKLSPVFKDVNLTLNGNVKGAFDFSKQALNMQDYVKELSFKIKTQQGGNVKLPDPLNATYPIKQMTAFGQLTNNGTRLDIQPVKLSLTNGINANVVVAVDGVDAVLKTFDINDIKTTLSADILNIPVQLVPKVWPSKLGSTAHEWVADNLSQGNITSAHFDLYFKGGNLDDLFGNVNFDDMRVDYLSPMKAVEKAQGKVFLYPDKVEIFVNKGAIDDIKLQKASVFLTQLKDPMSQASIDIKALGPVNQILNLLDSKPLNFISDFGLNPNQTSGVIAGDVKLKFPLTSQLTAKKVGVNVSAKARNVTISTPIENLSIDKGDFTIDVDNNGLFVQGTGAIQGAFSDLTWRTYFYPKTDKSIKSFYTFKGMMTNSIFAPFYDISSVLKGSFEMDAKIVQQKNNDVKITSTADLTGASIDFFSIVYSKKLNAPAKLTTDINLTHNFNDIDVDFNYTADLSTIIRGKYTKTPDNWQVNLDEVQSTESIFQAQIGVNNQQDIKAKVTGSVVNLSQLNKSFFGQENKKTPVEKDKKTVSMPSSDIDIDVSIDRLIVNPSAPIEQFSLKIKREETKWQNMSFLCEGKHKTMIQLNNETGKVTGYTKDIGDLLNRFNFTDQLVNGSARLNAKTDENGALSGQLDVSDLHVNKPGFLVQSLTILGLLDAIRGDNLVLDKGIIPFYITPDFKMDIDEGYIYGTTLGITFNGLISAGKIDVNGSVIPAYVINSLLGKIPLIGTLFKDQEGGGLMGVKYNLTGKLGATTVNFKTLSSIAPGILGKWF